MKYSREAVVLGAAIFASVAGAEPFTYQGVLQEAGMAAEGAYDIRFELYDSSNKSVQLGSTLTFDDVAVSGGTFTVDLDFGSGLFDGSDRFLFIEVRDGASAGGYTGLLPAIEITATPEAQHAMTADTVLNPQWTEAPGILTYGDGNDRVFINRSSPITTAEYFGVHSDTPGFVGMYVSGPTNSSPFYGYSIDSQISAYTYVEPTTLSWILNKNGDTALESDAANNLLITGNAVADSFEYSTPKTHYLSVPAAAFHAANGSKIFISGLTSSIMIGDSATGSLYAPVFLPHGAMITRMTAYCTDNSSTNMGINLLSTPHGGLIAPLITMSTFGLSGDNVEVVVTPVSPLAVDNSTHSYYLQASAVSWPSGFILSLQSVLIEYTTTEAD